MVTTVLHDRNTTVAVDPDIHKAEKIIVTFLKYMSYENVVSFLDELGGLK